ncbi:hypothetical protein [Halomarina litorea]|uniref:hypothetical protein n=1 Tax=Halomarina litorea TaxID=2961595 RepID=UPI0020C462D5|nr:hypothetical protein [Halomarina sp. BCD28]
MRPDHSSLQSQETNATPELPSLRPGVRLLEAPDSSRRQSTSVVQALVLDHLLLNSGYVEWVDAGGHASAQPIARLVPSERFLERITVARAFTLHQHASLVERLADRVSKQTALVVCPALDRPYREECRDEEAEALLLRAVARLSSMARSHDIPVLVTRTRSDEFADPIATAATECISYEETRYGPRFAGEGFETLVYPVGHGLLQTTIAFWQQMLSDRRPLYAESSQRAPAVVG